MAKPAKEYKDEPLAKQLWKAADKLRNNIDAAEYKHVVMGLIFLKYISDSFEEMFNKLQAGEGEYSGADPEDKDEYKVGLNEMKPNISPLTITIYSITYSHTPIRCCHSPLNVAMQC